MRRLLNNRALFATTRAGIATCAIAVVTGVFILALDIANVGGRNIKYVGVLTCTPFIAAAFATPVLVAAVGIATLLGAFEYGVYRDEAAAQSQIIRLIAIALATVFAMVVSYVRARRDRRIVALRRVAEVAQQALLRPVPPLTAGVRCAVLYRSAAAEARIGGDLYEVLDTPFGVRALIGDVRGKGLDAVRLASVVLGGFRHVAYERIDVADIARDLDQSVQREASSEDFVTCVIVEVGADGDVTIVNCGHPAPLLVDNESTIECTPTEASPPLGLGVIPQPQLIRLGEKSQLLLYTDGLVEARNREGDFFSAHQPGSKIVASCVARSGS